MVELTEKKESREGEKTELEGKKWILFFCKRDCFSFSHAIMPYGYIKGYGLELVTIKMAAYYNIYIKCTL